MDNKVSGKNRILKDALIVFMVVLVMLTFLSNALMRHFLPEVTVSTVGSGILNTAVRGTGTVSSASSAPITAPSARTIRSIEIKEGQTLKKGELMFTFEHLEDGEIEAELEALDQMFAEYNNYAMQTPLLTDYNETLWDITGVTGVVEHIPLVKLEYYIDVATHTGDTARAKEYQEVYDFAKKKIAETRNYETLAITSINNSLGFTSKRIEEQQELIKEMRGEAGYGNLFAPYDCTVTHISCKVGDTVEKGEELCVVETDSSEHTLSFVVPRELAECLKVGDFASVGREYIDSGIIAQLKDMKMVDTGYKLIFTMLGNVNSGDELTLFVGKRSAEFDTVVPNSAIHTDSAGSYVLTVKSMTDRLGTQYVAVRTAIEVIDSDDENSAVRGDLNKGDWIVVSASAPVGDHDQVRIENTVETEI